MVTVELIIIYCLKWKQMDSFSFSHHLICLLRRLKGLTQDRLLKRSDLEFKWT